MGFHWSGPSPFVEVGALALTLAVNFLIVYLIVGHLGGIRPRLTTRPVGAGGGPSPSRSGRC
jgi:hypothetical protein